MIPLLITGLIGLGVHYAMVMGLFALGFQRVRRQVQEHDDACIVQEEALPYVSVIVPARNEQASIRACVEAILRNDYPPERFELIVVDDASTDGTPAILRTLTRKLQRRIPAGGVFMEDEDGAPPRLHVLTLPQETTGRGSRKRQALEAGIESAKGAILLTTDADCLAPRTWIRSMVSAFHAETGFVAGPVQFPTTGAWWPDAQALEFLGLVTIGAGAIGVGRPILCNGANVAYRKEVFEYLNGFESEASGAAGDDELLMWKVAESGQWDVRFNPDAGSTVSTPSAPNLRAFIRQRLRWASLASQYPSPAVMLALVAIFLFYLMLLASLIALPFEPALWPGVMAAFALKTGAESLVLIPACRHYGRLTLLVWLVPAQVFQAVYIVFCAAAGTLRRFTWAEPSTPI